MSRRTLGLLIFLKFAPACLEIDFSRWRKIELLIMSTFREIRTSLERETAIQPGNMPCNPSLRHFGTWFPGWSHHRLLVDWDRTKSEPELHHRRSLNSQHTNRNLRQIAIKFLHCNLPSNIPIMTMDRSSCELLIPSACFSGYQLKLCKIPDLPSVNVKVRMDFKLS
jgi:hypothetical protein